MSEKGKNNPVYIQFKEEKTETGDSKFFGAPDLPEDFEWPVDEEEYDLEFICQINCAEAFKHNNMMPEKGILYFFGCIANPLGYKDAPEIKAGFQSERNFSVIYDDADINDLQSGEIVDENGEQAGFKELKITFSDDENVCTEAFHKLLGEFPEGVPEVLDEYKLLFCLDSFSGDDFTLEFENSGYLLFLIKDEDLKNKDFSKVRCFLAE